MEERNEIRLPSDSATERTEAEHPAQQQSDFFVSESNDETGASKPEIAAQTPSTGQPEDGQADAATAPQARGNGFVRWLRQWAHRWFIDAFNGMAQGLFATLIVGTILKTLGEWLGLIPGAFFDGLEALLVTAGGVASALMGAGIGAGIAHALKANKLVIFSAMIAGLIGAKSGSFLDGAFVYAGPGNPIGAYLAAIAGTEVCKLITGKTKVDIIALPVTMIAVAIVMAYPVRYGVDPVIEAIQFAITWATERVPFVMGVLLSVVVGILLTMPTSSAAICIAVGVGGIAGGAAVVGCCAHMVGFAVSSFRENKVAGLVAQGLGTSMLQIPNIMKRPIIMLPEIIASAIVGPLATCVFRLQCSPAGSGMGTAGLVGVLDTVQTSLAAGVNGWVLALGVILLMFVIPAAISLLFTEIFRKKGWIRYGDLKLEL